jgi:hypothetical protein
MSVLVALIELLDNQVVLNNFEFDSHLLARQ